MFQPPLFCAGREILRNVFMKKPEPGEVAVAGPDEMWRFLKSKKQTKDITNEQWELPAPLLPETSKGPRGQGGPASNEPRAILNGILWILRAGAPWKDMPERYSPYQTCLDGSNAGAKKESLTPCCPL